MRQANEKTVLVSEDDRNTAALVALYLKREGFRVSTATEDEVGQLAHAFNRMAESLEKIQNLRRNLIRALLPRRKIPVPTTGWRRNRPGHRQGTG